MLWEGAFMKTCCFSGNVKLNNEQKETVTMALLGIIQICIDEGYQTFKVSFCDDSDLIAAAIISQLKKKNKLFLDAVLPYSEILVSENKRIQKLLKCCNGYKLIQKEKNSECFSMLNQNMINNSERLIAVWNGETNNSTYNAIEYAKICGKDVKIIHI